MDNNTSISFKEFSTSATEMNRRKRAFQTLSISLFASCGISAWVFLRIPLQFYLTSMGVLGVCLIGAALSFNRLFDRSKNITITLSGEMIERKGLKVVDRCSIESIKNLRIKRTTSNQIREIRITRSSGSTFYLNGMDDFETVKEYLLSVIPKKVTIRKLREPIDFDHPLFYVFFGTFIGLLSIIALKIVYHMTPEGMRIFQLSIGCIMFFVGIFWFMQKPITGVYGRRWTFLDYGFIVAVILIGIALTMHQ